MSTKTETIKFALFKNDYKKADSHPDLKGQGEISYDMAVRISNWLSTVQPGTDMKISVAGWNSLTKEGKKYMSGSIQDADYKSVYTKPNGPVADNSEDEW